MTTLFWPGDDRAGDVFTDGAFLAAIVAVEDAWARARVDRHAAPAGTAADLTGLLGPADVTPLAASAEAGGNPVVPAVALLRDRLRARGDAEPARWLHRGLTSQDVVDTAVVLLARTAADRLRDALRGQVEALAAQADAHRATPMVGRTLTQHAVPIRFGGKVAGWLHGVLDAAEDLDRLEFPLQCGGAAGSLSGARSLTTDGPAALDLVRATADRLGLAFRGPWPTDRAPVTRIGDAFARCSTAAGRIANDVLTLSRPEIAELTEPVAPGRGGSSAMPQKVNPVLSVLVRRAALTAPALLSLLHLAAADARDERPDGAWHVEWQPLQQLARHAVTAADQTAELLAGLRVDTDAMADTLTRSVGTDAEARSIAELTDPSGRPPARGGADDALVDLARDRAAAWLARPR